MPTRTLAQAIDNLLEKADGVITVGISAELQDLEAARLHLDGLEESRAIVTVREHAYEHALGLTRRNPDGYHSTPERILEVARFLAPAWIELEATRIDTAGTIAYEDLTSLAEARAKAIEDLAAGRDRQADRIAELETERDELRAQITADGEDVRTSERVAAYRAHSATGHAIRINGIDHPIDEAAATYIEGLETVQVHGVQALPEANVRNAALEAELMDQRETNEMLAIALEELKPLAALLRRFKDAPGNSFELTEDGFDIYGHIGISPAERAELDRAGFALVIPNTAPAAQPDPFDEPI